MTGRVLLVCYYFPPLGLGGVGRPLHLFKRLSRYGWECDILTVKPVLYRAYEPELLEGLDTSRIYRSGSHDPQRLLYLMGVRRLKATTISKGTPIRERFFPDSKVGWVRHAVRLGNKLCRRSDYQAIISTSPPMSSHLVGMDLSRRYGIPWIADFRDFWTIYRAEDVFRDDARIDRAKGLLEQIKSQAAAVTTVNNSIAEYLGVGETITNGYDPDHAAHWLRDPSEKEFTIGLLGHQHDTREIEPLLSLLKEINRSAPDTSKQIRLLQVGQVDPNWLRGLINERGLRVRLDLRQRQMREDAIKILSEAHVFYYGVSEREGSGFLPGRTFELVASGRPILAYAKPDSEVARLLAPVESACCFQDDSLDLAVARLNALIESFRKRNYRFEPLSEYARQFSGDELARKFAQLMDKLV